MNKVVFETVPGTVQLLQATGNDNTIVCAALVSDQFDEVTLPEGRHFKLLEEMPMAGHWGCLDHAFITLKIDCPIFTARQILRASNMNFNEVSGRYLEFQPKFYAPATLYKDVKRKELAEAPEPVLGQATHRYVYEDSCRKAYECYEYLRLVGVRKEQARMVLPLASFTSFWMSGRLSDWLHFLNLRMNGHSQYETQFIAREIYECIYSAYPKTVDNWHKYAQGPINEFGTIQTP